MAVVYQKTTALTKIAALNKRISVIQGGQGAGKTIAILILIVNYAARNDDKEIIIFSHELAKMRRTVIKDFVKVMKSLGKFDSDRWLGGRFYTFPSGTTIEFIGLDKDDIGKGLRTDVVYGNEVDKVSFEAYRELTSRAKKVYIDYNPNKEFWAHTEIIPLDNSDFISLTYLDNEFLDINERREIESYQSRGYNVDGTIKNTYWANKWKVYGLGQIAALEGVVFPEWTKYKDLPIDLSLAKFYGIDWGGNDPTTFIEVNISKKHKILYLRQILYTPQILNSKLIDLVLEENQTNSIVVYDSARKDKGFELKMAGIPAVKAGKFAGSKIDQIDKIHEYRICVHEDSADAIHELESYTWLISKLTGKATNEPMDGNDHIIDPLGYVVRYYHKNYF